MKDAISNRTRIVGKSPLTGDAHRLSKAMDAINIDDLDYAQLENIERLCAAMMADIRQQRVVERGWKEKPWGKNGPGPVDGSFFDHHSHLVNADGREIFLVEPYELGSKGMRQLLALEGEWEISIRADSSMHSPGSTIDITFERKEDDADEATPPGKKRGGLLAG